MTEQQKVQLNPAYHVTPPESFTFSTPVFWSKWKQRFDRFRFASGLNKQPDEEQVNALIYFMGEKAEEIFTSFDLSDADRINYDVVIKKFTDHFIVKRNTIFERAQFNQRTQREGESVNDFITALYSLAEYCEYGTLHDELIRDRIVVGIKDKNLSEKLQLDSELTLNKVIERVRLSESVKKQQESLNCDKSSIQAISNVHKPKLNKSYFSKPKHSGKNVFEKNCGKTKETEHCKWCGKQKHERKFCPAKDAKCIKCSKLGHFARVCCRTDKKSEVSFLGTIGDSSEINTAIEWTVPIRYKNDVINFKIDSGADHTVIPTSIRMSIFKNAEVMKPDKKLCGPDGSSLKLRGKLCEEIRYGNKTTKEVIYVIDGLQHCLLGKPAIQAFGLGPKIQEICTVNPKKKFPELFRGLGRIEGCYEIKLKADSVPFAISAPRRIPIPLLKKTENEIKSMVSTGIIVPVTKPTEWCAPIVVVPKTDGNVRICVDLTELNKCVQREFHPLPSVEYTLNLLTGAKYFSKLDANSGFWQIPLDEKSSYLTTFITPFGRFRFLRLPFGISSAPEHFQRRMMQLLEKTPGTVCHMDDILIWGNDQAEHDQRLNIVLETLKNAGITLNERKCQFSVKRVKFLGHIIDEDGIHPDDDKVTSIKDYPPPKNKTELKQMLGMANYLARFVPNYAEMLSPLTAMLSNKNEFVWGTTQEKAFQTWKNVLTSNPVLKIFDPQKTSIVTTDASSYGIGATLRQEQENGDPCVIAYASRTLSSTEQRYAQIEKEALAIAWGCEKFRDYLTGTHFRLETDHKPLIPIFSKKNLDDLSPRLQRMKLRMMRYSFSIFHTPGKKLYAADALSRKPQERQKEADELEEELDVYVRMVTSSLPASTNRLKEIRRFQQSDPTCKALEKLVLEGWPSKKNVESSCVPYWHHRYEISVQDGLLMKGCRLIIPACQRGEVLKQIHEGHLGITKCRARARTSVYWPGINKEIEEMVKECAKCIKEASNPHQPLMPSEFPERPWEVVGMDLFKLNGMWYLIVTDYYSRYPEIAKLDRLTSSEVINHVKSIFARHGIPDIVRTDNGPQFEPINSSEFSEFSRTYGFRHITSSPRYPQSNGFVESAVKTIKLRLKKSEDPYLALMTYRATPLENGSSPAELLFNRRIQTTLPIAKSQLIPKMQDKSQLERKEEERIQKQTTNYNKRHGARNLSDLNPGDTVWVTDRRSTGRITHKTDHPRSYIVQTGKKNFRRNRKHLIPSRDFQPETDELDDLDPKKNTPGVPNPVGSHSPSSQVVSTDKGKYASHLSSGTPPAPYVTRSGRVVRAPERLDL